MKTFNVLLYKNNKIEYYDILPYFRSNWKPENIDTITSRKDFKEWIIGTSQYKFWARCQYEFLIAPWPFGSYQMNLKVRQVLSKENFDLGSYKDNIDFYNAVACDMSKIDVHEQIMMNIDIIVNILWDEFYVTKIQ